MRFRNLLILLCILTLACVALINYALSYAADEYSIRTIQNTLSSDLNTSANWRDNFDSEVLDASWLWVREVQSHWSLSNNPGSLQIVTQPKDLFESNNTAPLLLRPVTDDNFIIRTRIKISPTQNYHQGGLVIYSDDNNYMRLTFAHIDELRFEFASEIDGRFTSTQVKSPESDDFHLQVMKLGNRYLGYYSHDGLYWRYLGEHLSHITMTHVGLSAFNAPLTQIEIPADFDYFEQLDYGAVELFLSKQAVQTESQPGDFNSYTLKFENVTTQTLTISTITDTLHSGFTYRIGSTRGIIADDPQIIEDLQTDTKKLVWRGPFTIEGQSNSNLTFDVLIPSDISLGTYFNSAYATAFNNGEQASVLSALHVAPIRVTWASDIVIIIGDDDPISLPPDGNLPAIPILRGKKLLIRALLSCPPPKVVNSAIMQHNGRSYNMVEVSSGTNIYEATIPGDQVANLPLAIDINCIDPNNPDSIEVLPSPLPPPRLYDPSGIVTDAKTSKPIAGAIVTLYKIPNSFPDTSSLTRQDCRTINTRPAGDLEPWSGIADHIPTPADELADVLFEPAEIDPAINPQITGSDGRFGWDVIRGCWYVAVEAPNYVRRISPLVGVPPEVTDLNLTLMPESRIYIPLIRR